VKEDYEAGDEPDLFIDHQRGVVVKKWFTRPFIRA
jgi:hypothetical protein